MTSMASVNNETLNGLIRHFKDDRDDLEMIVRAVETFEDYHRAIYRLELTRRLFSCNAIDSDAYRSETVARDRTRTCRRGTGLCGNGDRRQGVRARCGACVSVIARADWMRRRLTTKSSSI